MSKLVIINLVLAMFCSFLVGFEKPFFVRLFWAILAIGNAIALWSQLPISGGL